MTASSVRNTRQPEEQKVALVTGAARRIGACIAKSLHAQGFRVIIHHRKSASDVEQLASELNALRPDSAKTVQADLCDQQDVARLGPEAMKCFARIDVLVNNASSFYPTEFGQSNNAQWDDLIDSNLRAAYFLTQTLSEELRSRQGAVINIVDSYADASLAGYPIYSIAKAGLKAMTRALAKELAPEVRVNAVSPGAILWPENLSDDNDESVFAKRAEILASIPLGRSGEANEIADWAVFLATRAHYMSGQTIRVDGGRNLNL